MAGNEQACPRCGSTDVRPAGVLRRHVNPLVFFVGGWLFSVLWSGSRREDMRCAECDTRFQRSTRVSRVVRIIFYILLALALLGLWLEIAENLKWITPPEP